MPKNISKVLVLILSLAIAIAGVFSCKSGSSNDNVLAIAALLGMSSEKKGEVEITFHDAPILDGNVTAVNMNILETQLVDFDDKIHVVSTEDFSFNLLNLTENNPVLLAHAKVEPGTYKQIRLILDDKTSLTFADGSTEPLKVPSSEQSGLKIDGIFTVPEGVLYTLDIDLDPNKSIHYTKGEGYIMKPVVTLTGADILQGNFAYKGQVGNKNFVFNLKSNGTFDMLEAQHPDYLISGNFKYDGIKRTFDMILSRVTCDVCEPAVEITENDFTDDMDRTNSFSINTWGKDYIEMLSEDGSLLTLRSVSNFSLSAIRKTVDLNVTVNVTNPEHEGRILVGMLYPVDGFGEAPIVAGVIQSNQTKLYLHLTESELPVDSARDYRITLAIVDSFQDIELGADGISSVNNVLDSKSGEETQFSLDHQEATKSLMINL